MPGITAAPLVGSTAGGTKVAVTAEGALPTLQKFLYCKFGDTTVVAESATFGAAAVSAVCVAPAAGGKGAVPLALSFDGLTYTDTGYEFVYHGELKIKQAYPSVGPLVGGTQVFLAMEGAPFPGAMGNGTTAWAKCAFDDKVVQAQIIKASGLSQVTCFAPAADFAGNVQLKVTIDGQLYSNAAKFTYLYKEDIDSKYGAMWGVHMSEFQGMEQKFRSTGTGAYHPGHEGVTDFYSFYGFYETGFYGFYEYNFYDFYAEVIHDLPADAPVPTDRVSELCMTALTPAVGPASGGTRVTIKMAGIVPENHDTFFCKFGGAVVVADAFYYMGSSPVIVCEAPAGSGTAKLSVSMDGETFTEGGAAFYYHADVGLGVAAPTAAATTGGANVLLELASDPMPGAFVSGITTVPATCKFDDVEVPAEYLHSSSGGKARVVCTTPAADAGVYKLKVSLDGQHYSEDAIDFTFLYDGEATTGPMMVKEGPFQQELEYSNGFYGDVEKFYSDFYNFFYFYQEFYAGDLYDDALGVPTYKPAAIPTVFDYLAFSPEYCLYFDAGANTALESLELRKGVLSPEFSPETQVYFSAVPKDIYCMQFSAAVADKGATFTVQGAKGKDYQFSDCIPLTVGENLVDIVVTGLDGSTKTYSVVMVRLAGTDSTLMSLELPGLAFAPAFSASMTGYTLSVPFSVSSTTVVVAATDVDADIKVDGSALASASSGTLLDTSGAVALSTGDTVITVSVTAEDKIGTSTYTITVTRDPGIRLTSLTLAPSSSANPWKGDGAGIDKVFDGYTYAYHLVTSPADSNAYVGLTTENPAVGVQVAVSAISDGLYNQQTYVSGVVNTATNTVAMADGSSYAHVTSYSMFSKTAANNVCYLLAKERSTTETWAIYKFTSCTATSLAAAMQDGLDLTGGSLGYSARLTAVAAGGSQNLGDNLHGPSSLATNLAVAYSGATLTVSDSGNQDATLAEYAVGTWTRLQGAATSVWETQCGSALLVGSGTTSVSISSGGSTNVCVPHGMQVVTITLSLQGFADRTYTVQIDRPSAESELMALTPSSGTLVPAFTSTTTAYRLEVAYTVSTASITPVAKSAEYAYIHYMVDDFDANDDGDMLNDDYYKTGAFAWAGVDLYYCGKNRDVAIEVSAQDAHLNGDPSGRSDGYWYGAGTKSQYAVQLYRMSNPIHAELTGIAVKQTNIQSTFATTMSPASFASATTTYTMSSDYSGATSAYLTITWNADQSIADGLDRAQWGGKVTGTAFVSSTQSISYSSSMESGTTALTVSSASNTADIGPFAVVEGQTNTVSITLTSCDTLTTKTYTVALGKLSLDDATLSNLVPTTGSLDSAFSKSDFAYAMVVDSYTTSVKFTATVAVGGATLQLDGTTITSGQEVTVTLADNTAAASTTAAVFKVIAVDGQSFKTYTVTITRQMGTKVGLTSFALTANGASLDANTGAVTTAVVGVVAPSPAWNVDTTSYTYTLAYSDQYVTFAPVLEDPKASVKVDFLGTGTVTTLTSGATSAIFPAGATGCKPLHAQTCEISGCAEMPFSANGLTTTVTVTSHDGLTTRSYSLLIARPAPPTPALSSVRVATYGNTANPTVVEVFNSIDSDANACISDAELKSALASVQGGITDASVLYTISGATGNACFNLALLETLLKQLATESAAPYNSFTTYGFVPTTAQAIVLAAADTYFRGKSVLSSANTYSDYASPLVQESAFRKVVFAPIANHPFSGQTGSGTQYFRDANSFTVLGTASASGCPTFFDYDYGTKDVAVYMGNAGGGAPTTVTPTLSRPLAGSAQLSSVSSTDGTVTPTFAASTYAYSIPVSDLSVKTGTLTLGIATGASVAVTVASGTVTNVGPVYTVPLAAAADTVVTVVVTAADGSLGATYTVTFDKDNTLLQALSVADSNATAVTLTPVFAAPVDYQAHVTNYTTAGIVTSVDYIDVTATPAEATATVTLSGYGSAQTPIAQGNGVYRIPLTGGWKDFTLTITVAFGGSTRAYTLNVDAVETYPDPTKSTVVPPAVTTVKPTAFALSITAFTKEGLVATAGVFVCSVPVGTGTVAFSSTTDGTGKYTVAFTTLTTAKSYTYTCTLDGVTIVNGVGTFTIIAGDLGTSTTVELAETFVRGEAALVFVTAKDSYGNKIEKADENKNMVATLVQVDTRVSTVLTLTPSSVAGRFSASITPPTSYTGKYQILLRLTPTGTTLTYTFETTRSLDTDPAKFWQLSVLPAYTAGAAQAVTVIPLTTAEYDAAAKFANGTFPLLTAEVKSGVDGAVVKTLTCPPTRALAPCSFDLGLNVAQAYSLSLFYGVGNKSPMGCGRDACAPSTFAVGPSVGLAAETTVTAVPATVAAGASTVVKVSVKDAFKNPAATSSIIVFFKDPVSKLVVPSNVTQDALGSYSATTVLVKQGTYDVEVKMGAAAIAFAAGVSTTVQVTAGPVFPLNTVVSGSGTQAKVTADDTLTLSATLRDALGNLAAGDATVVLEVTGPVGFNQAFTKVGTAYEISYSVKTAGNYTAVLKVNNVPLPPAVIEVVAGAVSFPDTVVQSAVPPYQAGKIASFGITLQDKNGNANPTGVGAAGLFFFQSTVTTATGEAFAARDVSMNLAPTARGSAGMYTVTFVATKPAGVYTVQLVLNQLVVKQTTAVTILPGLVDVAKTKVDGSGLLGGKAGELLTFSVTPADIYGNVRAADAVTALVTVTLPDKTVKTIVPTLTAGTAGTTVAYTSTDAGSVAIVVSVGGEKTPTAYSGTISPGPVSATQSTITGLSSCVPNQKSTFTITSKDDFGNAITAGGAPFLASLVQAADGTVTIAETPGKPGEYTVEYTITKAGTFNIKVELKTLLGLLPVGGSPAGGLAVEVLDDGGQFSAPLSTAKIVGTPRAGESATVSIAARTDKDIAMTTGGIKFVVKVNGALVEGLTTDNQDGTYLYTFQVLLKGSFTVDVFAESDLPANRVATLPLVVSAGAPAASTSTLFSESMSLTAGGDLVVDTVLNDANMNQVLYDALGPVPFGFSAIATLNGTQVFLTPALTSVGGIQFSGKLLFAGTYTVTATLPSTFPAPFKTLEGVTVAPGPVSPAMSTVGDFPATLLAAQKASVLVLPKDSYGNAVSTACQATVGVPPSKTFACQPAVSGPGMTIEVDFQDATTVALSVALLHPVEGYVVVSQQSIVVTAGAATAVNTFIESGQYEFDAGSTATFTVVSRDKFDNALKIGGLPIVATLSGTKATFDGEITDKLDGTYTVSFGKTQLIISEGDLKLDVKLGDKAIVGSGATVKVKPAPGSPLFTFVSGTDGATVAGCTGGIGVQCVPDFTVTAGSPMSLKLSEFSIFGTASTGGSFTYTVEVAPGLAVGMPPAELAAAGSSITQPVFSAADSELSFMVTDAEFENSAGIKEGLVYMLTVKMAGVEISNSPVYFDVTSAAAVIDQTVVKNTKLETDESTGSDLLYTTLLVETYDQYGNVADYDPTSPLTLSVTTIETGTSISRKQVMDGTTLTGSFVVGIGAKAAGDYSVLPTLNGVDLGIQLVTILPGDIVALELEVDAVAAGVETTASFVGKDRFDNEIATETPLLLATQQGKVTADFEFEARVGSNESYVSVTDPAEVLIGAVSALTFVDGNLAVKFTPKAAGTLVVKAAADLDGTKLVGVGEAVVSAGAVDVSKVAVSGPGMKGALVNTAAFFSITPMDSFGNYVAGACADFKLDVTATTSVVEDPKAASCKASYTLTTEGSVSLPLSYKGAVFQTLTVLMESAVGDPDPAKSVVSGAVAAGGQVKAGSKVELTVAIVSTKDILVPDSQGAAYVSAAASAGGAAVQAGTVVDNLDGTYGVTFDELTSAVAHQIALTVGGVALEAINVTVTPGPLDLESSLEYGSRSFPSTSFTRTVSAGDDIPVAFYPTDEHENEVDYNATKIDSISVKFDGVFYPLTLAGNKFDGLIPTEMMGTFALALVANGVECNTTACSGTVTVNPGLPHVPNSIIFGDGLEAIANEESYFMLKMQDKGGNEVDASAYVLGKPDAFLTSVSDSNVTVPTVVTAVPQLPAYKIAFLSPMAGLFTASFSLFDENVTLPQFVDVQVGEVDPAKSSIVDTPTEVSIGTVTFGIEVTDAYENPITTDPLAPVEVRFIGTGDVEGEFSFASVGDGIVWDAVAGKYAVALESEYSGTYELSAYVDGVEVANSPVNVTLLPGAVDPAETVVSGVLANATVEVGTPLTLQVVAKDANANTKLDTADLFEFEFSTGLGGEYISTYFAASGPGTYTYAFTPTKAAEKATVTVGFVSPTGEVVDVEDIEFTVAPSTLINATMSTGTVQQAAGVTVGAPAADGTVPVVAVAGAVVSTVVAAKDIYGNPIPVTDAQTFTASVNDTAASSPLAALKADGTVEFAYTPTATGDYEFLVVLPGSPVFQTIALTVVPADVSTKSTISTAASTFTAGVESSFTLKLFDTYDNSIELEDTAYTAAGLASTVTVLSTVGGVETVAEIPSSIAKVGDEFLVSFTPTSTGSLVASVANSAGTVAIVSAGVPVVAGPVDATKTVVSGSGTESMSAGATAEIILETFDSAGNKIEGESSGAFTLDVTPAVASAVAPTVAFVADGSYRITFGPGSAADLGIAGAGSAAVTVSLKYDGTEFKSIPVDVFVAAGEIDGPSCVAINDVQQALGAVVDDFSVDDDVAFAVQARDNKKIGLATGDATLAAKFTVDVVPAPTTAATVTYTTQGLYLVTFKAEKKASYFATVKYDGALISNGEINFKVSAGAPTPTAAAADSADSALIGLASKIEVEAGSPFKVYLTVKDQYGNDVDSLGRAIDSISAKLDGGSGVPEVAGTVKAVGADFPAKVEVEFTADVVLEDYELLYEIAGAETTAATVAVTPGSFDYAKSVELSTAPVEPAITAGAPFQFGFAATDSFGNTLSETAFGALDVTVEAKKDGETFPGSTASTPAGVVGELELYSAGTYTFTVAVAGETLLEFAAPVKAGPVDVAKSSFTGTLMAGAIAGDVTSLEVTPVDAYGNANVEAEYALTLPASFSYTVSTTAAKTLLFDITPKMFGDYQVDVQYDGQSLGGMPILVSIAPRSPPEMVKAEFSAELLSLIEVTFSEATNMANLGAGKDCTTFVAPATVAKLGEGAECSFPAADMLVITLGSGATILPVGSLAPDMISLDGNALRNADGNSRPVVNEKVLQPPSNVDELSPIVVVSIPTDVGVCEDLEIDASKSYVHGGRPMTFDFQVSGLDVLAVSQELNGRASDKEKTVTIDKNLMAPDSEMTFTVTVTNFLGRKTSASFPVKKSNLQLPTMVTNGDLSVLASDKVIVGSTAVMPGKFLYNTATKTCEENTGKSVNPLVFQWQPTVASANFPLETLPNNFLATLQKKDMEVPTNFLEAGKKYVFEVSGALASAPDSPSKATSTVTVGYSPIEVSIAGGNRKVSSMDELKLDVVVTDPDEVNAAVTVQWDTIPGLARAVKKYLITDAALKGQLTIPADSLAAGTYTFTASVSKAPVQAGRTNQKVSVVITVAEMKVPVVTTTLVAPKKGIPKKGLPASRRFVADCATDLGTIAWSVTSLEGDLAVPSEGFGPGIRLRRGGARLVIKANTLSSGVKYTVTCTATTQDAFFGEVTSFSEMSFLTRDKPTSGSLTPWRMVNKVRRAVTKVLGDDDACQFTAVRDAISPTLADWVSKSPTLFYELQARSQDNSTVIKLGLPSATNLKRTLLPEGYWSFEGYVKTSLDPSSALDAPLGAFIKTPFLRSCPQGAGRRSLLQDDAAIQADLNYDFAVALAEGDVVSALSKAQIYGSEFGAASLTDDIKSSMAAALIEADKLVIETGDYNVAQSCSLQTISQTCVGLTFNSIIALAENKIKNIYSGISPVGFAQAPQDSYSCFVSLIDALMGSLASSLGDGSCTISNHSKHAETLLGLLELIGQEKQKTLEDNFYYKNPTLSMFVAESSAKTSFAIDPSLTIITGDDATVIVTVIDSKVLNEPDAGAGAIVGIAGGVKGTFSLVFPEIAVPDGYQLVFKTWDGAYDDQLVAVLSDPDETITYSTVDGQTVVTIPSKAESLVVVPIVEKIPYLMEQLEVYATPYSGFQATSAPVKQTFAFIPTVRNYTFNVGADMAFAGFKGKRVEGATAVLRHDGAAAAGVDVTAKLTTLGELVPAGPIKVHKEPCLPGGTCVPAGAESAVTISLIKGDMTEPQVYRITFVRPPSTTSSLKGLKVVVNGKSEKLYTSKGSPAVAFSPSLLAAGAYLNNAITTVSVELQAEANFPVPYFPHGAALAMAGAGFFGAGTHNAVGGNLTAPIGDNADAKTQLLVGVNPVLIEALAQSGASTTEVQLGLYRMGKPVFVSERYVGLSLADFESSQEAQDTFIAAKAKALGVNPEQIEIYDLKKGSVIFQYVIYPVVETVRQPEATDEQRAQAETAAETANLNGAVALFTKATELDGQGLDFGKFGGTKSTELRAVELPKLPLPADFVCPTCPPDFESTGTSGNNICQCVKIITVSTEDLNAGEIAGIAIGSVAFVALVGGALYYWYNKKKQAAKTVLEGTGDEEEEEEVLAHDVELEEET